MNTCTNHPGRKALSVCHGCGKYFCKSCLDEGEEFYYCKSAACQELLKKEKKTEPLPKKTVCPVCSSELELSDEDRASRKYHCPVCEAFVDSTMDPPRVWDKKNYALLLTTMNQADIAIIKSVLENASIDYYVYDEDFLAVRPLVQPARFFVVDNQMEEAKETLKDLKLKYQGVTIRNDPEE